jgi:CelD/BcsL family acetyltransferase involved in cellulose biosynthesis
MTIVLSRSRELGIVADLNGLRQLRSEWDETAPPQDTEPWRSFIWIEAAATAYSSHDRLRVMSVRKGGRLAAIAPLVLKPSEQPLRPLRLDFLGGEELKEPNGFVSLDPESLDLLTDSITSERVYPIRLSRITNDGGMVDRLGEKFRKAGWICKTLSMPYPYLDLGSDPVRKSLREDLRRARRKAEKRGGARSELVAVRSKQELRQYLQRSFAIEGSGWKGRNGTSILSDGSRREFFERYAYSAWDQGSLRLFFLSIGNEAVAVQYGIESANAYWLLNIGYDEEYRECSPGNLLLEDTVKWAVRSGLSVYNFLGKEEPWIRRWTSEARDCTVLAAYRPNRYGLRAILSDALYVAQKKRKKREVEIRKKERSVRHTDPGF